MYSVNDWLHIGKYRDTRDLGLLRTAGIAAMLQLAELVEQPGIKTLYLPVEDGEAIPLNLLAKGLVFVEDQFKQKNAVMIACGAGISRSVTFAMAALRELEGDTLTEAFRAIQSVHPAALPHPALLASLCSFYMDEPSTEVFLAIHHIEKYPLD